MRILLRLYIQNFIRKQAVSRKRKMCPQKPKTTPKCLMQKGTCCELFFSSATVRVIGKTFVKILVEKTKRLSRNKETYPKMAPS